MRKIYSLLAMMVLALGIPAVAQGPVQNYVEDFDALDTSNHEFARKDGDISWIIIQIGMVVRIIMWSIPILRPAVRTAALI